MIRSDRLREIAVRALVVDDSRAMRMILTRILTRCGFSVNEAGDGRIALDVLEGLDFTPDLALIDWNMPEMNGYELIQALRADSRYTSMTLMMVTTESEQNQIVRALAAGAHEYVIKPFTPEAIVEKLELLGFYAEGPAA
jgi:two-component system chemotaxis response regulator CheY